MKASNLTLAIAIFFFSSTNYINAQQDIGILAKIDEAEDYQEQKKQNIDQYANLWRADLQLASSEINSRFAFYSTSLNSATESAQWVALDLTDDGSALIALPFEFEFFGDTYREIWVNANGNVSFNESVGSYKSENFPIVVSMIAPFWTDLVPVDDRISGVFVCSEAGRVHILWKNMKINTPGVEDVVSFELTLQANKGLDENPVFNDFNRPQGNDHHGGGNQHIIIISYSEMRINGTRGAENVTAIHYMAGINSGNKKCGYHSFYVGDTSLVAYITK